MSARQPTPRDLGPPPMHSCAYCGARTQTVPGRTCYYCRRHLADVHAELDEALNALASSKNT